MAADPIIQQKSDDIRTKTYGREVRESLASGLEAMSSDVVEVEGRQDEVESQFQDVIDETTGKDIVSAPEIIAARNGKDNLKDRIDTFENDTTAQLAQKAKKVDLDTTNTNVASKANQSEVRLKVSKIKSDDLDETLLGAMTGTGSVNLLSEPQDESVHPVKFSTSLQAVLSKGYSWELGGVNTAGSLETNDIRIRTTSKVLLKAGTILKLLDSDVFQFGIAEFNLTDESLIKNHTWQWGDEFTIPNDNKYIIYMRRYSDSVLTDEIQLVSSKLLIFTNDSLYYKLDEVSKKSEDMSAWVNDTSAVINKSATFEWELGVIGTNGNVSPANDRIRTKELVLLNEGETIDVADSDYEFAVNQFTLDTQTFVEGSNTGYVNSYKAPSTAYYQIAMRNKDNSSLVDIISETASKLWVFGKPLTDKIQNQIDNTNPKKGDTFYSSARELLYEFDLAVGTGSTIVGDEYWRVTGVEDDGSQFTDLVRVSLDFENETYSILGRPKINWGHSNTVDYNKRSDSLLVGGPATGWEITHEAVYLFEEISTKKEQDTIDRTEAIKFDFTGVLQGHRFQGVWGEENNGKHNIIYVLSDDADASLGNNTGDGTKYINKIMLGKGSNVLENGTFLEGLVGFNGTYKVLGTWTGRFENHSLTQDAQFYNGKLYEGCGHDGIWISETTLNENGSYERRFYRERFYDDNGNLSNLTVQSISLKEDMIFIGSGSTTNRLRVYRL